MTGIIIAIVIASVYILLCTLFYFFQHLFFFRPEILSHDFVYKYPFPFEELHFEREDGGSINAIYFKVPNPRGVIYYLKGNSRSIKGWGKFARDFLSNGYDFVMMDYRGFGKSRGKRTQETLFGDAQFLYQWLQGRYPESSIVVFGRSLGTGIAAKVASDNHPRLLVLDSPYYSFYHNINRYVFFLPLRLLMRYDLRTDLYLQKTSCPVHLIHGTKDRLIPISQSRKLAASFPTVVALHEVPGAGHNNLPDFHLFFEILYDILYVDPASIANQRNV